MTSRSDQGFPPVSVIIPARDEATRIAGVLGPLATTAWLTQRIVVDDGSVDGTSAVAAAYPGVEVVRLSASGGKGAALQAGLALATGEVVVFLDADLCGLEPRHVAALVRPLVAHDELGMTIGRFVDGRFATDLSQAIAPILNGQRALRRRFIDRLPDLSPLGYGVETFLTRFAGRIGERTRTVRLPGLAQFLKEEKADHLDEAVLARIDMYIEAFDGWNQAGRVEA